MSKLSQLKKTVGYQERVPRCSTCKHYNEQQLMRDSMPTFYQRFCTRHHFQVKAHACCDNWQSTTGEVLA
ncbi:hypothetical protein [Comamonas odontotermitis]|uniref:hypothetical protein n=1 Tax=Comamonas odontotermitis TaxID=379895 RepID=UPI001CC5B9ED|nr:hypothetical protein [Comamonas odontotermitis]UBB19527.1 hypothetical protein LAD35_22240 [Comamonas odontotermitis]